MHFDVTVPTVVDRFVQQAVAQVLTPIFEEQFHDHSYGFRPNRCAQQAVLKALEMMNDGRSWIVDIDMVKFFDTVNHDKLMTIFGRTIKDGDVISVVRKFLASGVMIGDEYEDTVIGTLQGGLCGARHNPPYAERVIMPSKSPERRLLSVFRILYLGIMHHLKDFRNDIRSVSFVQSGKFVSSVTLGASLLTASVFKQLSARI